MTNILIWAQLVVSIVLIALILLQQRGTALGSAFGQESGFGDDCYGNPLSGIGCNQSHSLKQCEPYPQKNNGYNFFLF
ncbi:MAG: hypothetical protein UU78_C0078G0005 [Candidatus Roizmanbacteria bacterium GW2011_GWC2_41_7]|uniref:Protein-export membrane protein SecG n=1 Tax=Candidatus Roizmanbacteria bacterium GW2011_GWC2_41_7 TaxID=1618487 RepID=A0A0G0ZC62_9BACT|nr:MAG: hypothetical protein UU78_C0078G0005 [Candidatus Roizmanbacteria bacterium GW2011_GWC2_41_7]